MQMVAKIGKNKSKSTNKVVKKKALKSKKPNVSKHMKASNKPSTHKTKPTMLKAKTKSKAKSSVTSKSIGKRTKKTTKNIAKPTQTKKSTISKKIQYNKAKPTHKPVVKQNVGSTKSIISIKKPSSKPTHKEHHNHLIKHENINIIHQKNDLTNLDNSAFLDSSALSGPSKFKPYHIDVTEGYMNEQQLQHFANILEAWRQELMMEVDNTITEMKEADILADPNDRATQEETFNLELRTRDRERKLIKKIEAALTKINEQRYGYCDTCGVEIGVRRLEARPTATLCIECKTLAEIREKRI